MPLFPINKSPSEMKQFNPLFFISLICNLVFFQAGAQQLLSLEEALSIGLKQNYSILIAKEDLEIAKLDNQLGNAGFLPKLDIDGRYSETNENTELNFADGTSVNRDRALSTNLNLGLQANWVLFDGTKMFLTKEKLEEMEAISALGVKANINNTMAEIMSTYYQIVAERKTLELIKQQLDVARQRLEFNKVQLDAGATSELQALQAEVDVNAIQSDSLDQQLRLKQAKMVLNRTLGRAVDEEFIVQDSISISSNFDQEKLLQQLKNNPNLIAIEKQQNIAILERKESFAERMPQISLDGRFNYNESESEAGFVRFNQADGFIYGASINIPIFNGNEKNRQEQQNKIRIERSRLQYEEELALAKEQLLINLEMYVVNKNRLKFEEQNVALAQKNLKFSLESFEQGGISALELREVQFSTFAAEERLVAIKYSLKQAEIELLRLTNQLVNQK